ncbi:MAG: aminopeptidase P family protein [Candidatus Cloacimonetes bacterium]|nr:aminopeptidase P family protein [Candidatus Cloacimonadota bacterium]
MNKELIEKRREKLNSIIDNNNLVLLYAASDDGLSYVQNKNFYYFTGLEIPEVILAITKRDGKLSFFLFIERNIPERVVWDGEKMSKETARKISSIEKVFYLDELERVLAGELFDIEKIFIEIEPVLTDRPLTRPLHFAEEIRLRYPQIDIVSFRSVAANLRIIKDEWEVKQLKKAIDVTGRGLKRVFQEARAGMYEYQLEAMLQYELLANGLRNWGFKPIVAGGKNATTLHYIENNKKIAKNDLVLIDVGALYNNYCADITRTFPIAAKFSKRQKEIYTEVLKAQESIISMIEPGLSLKDLNSKTIELLTESLIKLKVIKKPEDYKKYYMHGVSHFLGMAAHDVSLYYSKSILEPGNIITVEPGLYIPEENIGIRIEDDVLVTESGHEVLSKNIPKQIEELEAIRKRALEKK